jgi:hypothetical protein
MPELKINSAKYEVMLLKHRRIVLITSIVAFIIFLLTTIFILQSLGLIFNSNIKDVNYTLEDKSFENKSLISNQELIKPAQNGKVKVNIKDKKNSYLLLIKDNGEIDALTEYKNDNITFSNFNTLTTLISFSPQFSFLNNDNLIKLSSIIKEEASDSLKNKIKETTIAQIIQSNEYIEFLNKLNSNSKVQEIIENNYKLLKKKNLPGFLNSNKNYPWSIQMDNYQSTFPSKFYQAYGIEFIDDKSIPRINNTAYIYQNLYLVETLKDVKDINTKNSFTYQVNQLINPTFYENGEKDISLYEELRLEDNFPNNFNEYNLYSSQISNNDKIPNALAYNISNYLDNLLNKFSSQNFKRSVENLDQIVNTKIQECKDKVEILKCFNEVFEKEIEKRFAFESNTSNQIFLKLIKESLLSHINNETKYYGKEKTSPFATTLYFLKNPYLINGNVKTKPPLITKDVKINNLKLIFDGSFEVISENNQDNDFSITLNKQNILIDLIMKPTLKPNYYCTNDLDLVKLDNTLYKTPKPVWNNNQLTLSKEELLYFKTDNKYIQNIVNNNNPNGLKEVNEADASRYKNCFKDENLYTLYNGVMIRINARHANKKEFTSEEITVIDNLVKKIVIDKK